MSEGRKITVEARPIGLPSAKPIVFKVEPGRALLVEIADFFACFSRLYISEQGRGLEFCFKFNEWRDAE